MRDILRRLESEAESYRAVLADLDTAIMSIRRVLDACSHGGHLQATETAPRKADEVLDVKTFFPELDMVPVNKNGKARTNSQQGRESKLGDLTGVTIKAAASHVLAHSGNNKLDFHVIAQRAVELGYRSVKHGDDVDQIAYYFLDNMRRDRETFERDGKLFRLKAGKAAISLEPKKVVAKTLADYAVDVFVEADVRAMKTAEIMDGIKRAGYGEPKNPKTFYNAVYSALDRSPRFRRGQSGEWNLIDNTLSPDVSGSDERMKPRHALMSE